MSWKEIKELQEKRTKILADMHGMVKEAGKSELGTLNDEQDAKFQAMTADAESMQRSIQNFEQLEADLKIEKDSEIRAKAGREVIDAPNFESEDEGDNEKRAAKEWDSYLRGKIGASELRALTTAGMGVTGPRGFDSNLARTYADFSGVLQSGATVFRTDNGQPWIVPTEDDTSNSGAIYGEGVTVEVDEDPTLGNKSLEAWKYSSKIVKVPSEMLQDSGFDLQGYIFGICDTRIGRNFNTDSTVGNGTTKAHGYVTDAATGKTAAATGAITYGELVDFVHSVDPAYRNASANGDVNGKAILQMNDTTLAYIRKMVDTNGDPLWNPTLHGIVDNILGYKYVINNAMATIAAAAKVISFGDFSAYYVREVGAPSVRRLDELYAGNDQVGFVVHRRLDGILTNTSAVKNLVMAAV